MEATMSCEWPCNLTGRYWAGVPYELLISTLKKYFVEGRDYEIRIDEKGEYHARRGVRLIKKNKYLAAYVNRFQNAWTNWNSEKMEMPIRAWGK